MVERMAAAVQRQLVRWAIDHDGIRAHYQPQVRLSDGALIGFEALLRWRTEDGELRLPRMLRLAFSEHALACEVGLVMRRKVMRDLADWRSEGIDVLPIAINVTPTELTASSYVDRVFADIEAEQLDPSLLVLEVTEDPLSDERLPAVAAALETLRAAGLRTAMDDFGAGHSVLSRLLHMPTDVLKIDRSYVASIETPRGSAVVASMLDLGRSMGCEVIAEGIETSGQVTELRRIGCEYGQGYLFGRPMDAAAARELLVRRPTVEIG